MDDSVQIKLRGRKEWLILSFHSAPTRSCCRASWPWIVVRWRFEERFTATRMAKDYVRV